MHATLAHRRTAARCLLLPLALRTCALTVGRIAIPASTGLPAPLAFLSQRSPMAVPMSVIDIMLITVAGAMANPRHSNAAQL